MAATLIKRSVHKASSRCNQTKRFVVRTRRRRRKIDQNDKSKWLIQLSKQYESTMLFSALLVLLLLSMSMVSDSSQQLFVKNGNQNLQQTSSQQKQYYLSEKVPTLSTPLFASATSSSSSSSLSSTTTPLNWRSHHHNHHQQQHHHHQSQLPSSQLANEALEARGSLSRNLYLRSARNASSIGNGGGANSWHFPRISPEHAAEVLLTGAQVINRIAQAESPLNYCKTPDNQEGECSDIRKCIWLVLDKARLKQSVCLRNLIIPAVCCPISTANNTPIANMIQSTLEPVLFRPKAPKQKKQTLAAHMKPFASIVNKTIVGSPPPSPASLIIRNPPHVNGTSTTSTTTTTTTTEFPFESPINKPSIQEPSQLLVIDQVPSITTQVSVKPFASSSSSSMQLFQDDTYSPPPPTSSNAAYNRTLSLKYPWANETCGEGGRTRTGRIVGGNDSKLGQWPWMTAMYLNKRSTFSSGAGEFWCGGALINRRFILTAAHCLSDQRGNRYKNDQVTIKLGGVDLVRHQAPLDILRNGELEQISSRSFHIPPTTTTTGQRRSTGSRSNGTYNQQRSDEDEEEFSWTSFITKALGLGGSSSSSSSSSSLSPSQTGSDGTTKALGGSDNRKQQLAAHAKKTYFKEYKVASIKQHPKFQRHGFYNDIGLIELKSDVDYDDLISPICLPTEYDLKRDLSGYMATVLGWGTLSYGGQGSKLLQQVAMPIWNNKDCDDRYLQHIGKTFLCAGFLTGGKDACQGDSGGPLMVSDKSGRWTLHGVVSFGKTCAQAGYPGVYTRVTEYLDWIRDNTDLNGYYHSGVKS